MTSQTVQKALSPKRAVPIILFTFVWMGLASDLVIDQPTAVRVLEIAKTR